MMPCLGCGALVSHTRCANCAQALYGRRHRAERARWAQIVATGVVRCATCGELIKAATPWDLGHQGTRPSRPEHASCNRRKQ